MLFHIDQDAGHSITGWLITDNPAEVPEFKLSFPDREGVRLKANVFRKDLIDLGLHTTGMAGFYFDEQAVPGLSEAPDFLLTEASTGFPFYRRFDATRHLEKRFLLIDTAAVPQMAILKSIMRGFTLRYMMLDRFSLESMTAALAQQNAPSIFASGKVNWPRFSSVIDGSRFLTAALLNDPFDDMAERILLIRMLGGREAQNFSAFPIDRYRELVPTFSAMDINSERSILNCLRGLDREQRRMFRSPMTACFGALPEEDLQRRNVSAALDNLARVDVVGTRARMSDFLRLVELKLEIKLGSSDTQVEVLPDLPALSARLRNIGLVEAILDEDIALYAFASEALEAAFSRRGSTVESVLAAQGMAGQRGAGT